MKKPMKMAIMLLASSALAGLLTKNVLAQGFDFAEAEPVYKTNGFCFMRAPNLHWYMLDEKTAQAWDMTALGEADPSFYAKERLVRICKGNKSLPLLPPPPIDHVTGLTYHGGVCRVCLGEQGVFVYEGGEGVQNARNPTAPVSAPLAAIVRGLCKAFE